MEKEVNSEHYSRKLYTNIAKDYDKTRWGGKGAFANEIQKELLDKILKLKGIDKNQKILEVGCGTGRFFIPLIKEGYNMYGLDYSEGMISKLKENIKEENLKFDERRIIQGDARKMPFKENTFDLVISYRTLIHIPDYELVLKEIGRVLKPNGIAIIEFNNKKSISSIARFYRNFLGLFKELKMNPVVVSVRKLKKQTKNTELNINQINYQFFVIEPVFRKSPIKMLNFFKSLEKSTTNSILESFSTRLIVVFKKG